MFCTNRLVASAMSRSMLGVFREYAANSRVRRAVSLIILLAGPLTCAASGTAPAGYAALVRHVAPSVVTVMVEEKRVSAGQRAAERANPDDGFRRSRANFIRRLLSGASGNRSAESGASAALGSGFVIRADGYIVTNRHVIVDARVVHVRLPMAANYPRSSWGPMRLPISPCSRWPPANCRSSPGLLRCSLRWRPRHRHWQSVWPGAIRERGYRLRTCPYTRRRPVHRLPANRCGDQPRQLRRPLAVPRRHRRWRHLRDFFAQRRLRWIGLRHSRRNRRRRHRPAPGAWPRGARLLGIYAQAMTPAVGQRARHEDNRVPWSPQWMHRDPRSGRF